MCNDPRDTEWHVSEYANSYAVRVCAVNGAFACQRMFSVPKLKSLRDTNVIWYDLIDMQEQLCG